MAKIIRHIECGEPVTIAVNHLGGEVVYLYCSACQSVMEPDDLDIDAADKMEAINTRAYYVLEGTAGMADDRPREDN